MGQTKTRNKLPGQCGEGKKGTRAPLPIGRIMKLPFPPSRCPTKTEMFARGRLARCSLHCCRLGGERLASNRQVRGSGAVSPREGDLRIRGACTRYSDRYLVTYPRGKQVGVLWTCRWAVSTSPRTLTCGDLARGLFETRHRSPPTSGDISPPMSVDMSVTTLERYVHTQPCLTVLKTMRGGGQSACTLPCGVHATETTRYLPPGLT